jgi:hypothetical protein
VHIVQTNPNEHDRMVKSVEGVYRNGKVELVEPLAEGSTVIVTWFITMTLSISRKRR